MYFRSVWITACDEGKPAAELLAKRLARWNISEDGSDAPLKMILEKNDSLPSEAVRVRTDGNTAVICASDIKGFVYGVGRFLRACVHDGDGIRISDRYAFSGQPTARIRGMQIGYRALSNANDSWSKEQYTDYIEELAMFGANAIEILPDDEKTPAHCLMKYAVEEMNRHIAEVCHRYGLAVWYWLPHKGHFMDTPETCAEMLDKVEEKLKALPYLDHIFIPGADPGDLEPQDLFRFAEGVKQRAVKYHPKVGMWLSPQVFSYTPERQQSFFEMLQKEPEWLDGVVFGPWERDDAFTLRKKTPRKYPIRNYPDISHSFHCQYPVPNWDKHWARTLGRECVNPRPLAMKNIQNKFADCFVGSVCYSDGITDDINKFVWLDQEWDPDTDVKNTLKDYARLFISPLICDSFSELVLKLEQNLNLPPMSNPQIEEVLYAFENLSEDAALKENYRFRLCHLRAVYDACIRQRVIHDADLENRACEMVLSSDVENIDSSVNEAMACLNDADAHPIAVSLEKKAWAIADALYELIGLQSSVEKYHAMRWMRAAFMDGLRMPFNDRKWYESQVRRIAEKADITERYKAYIAVFGRKRPGRNGIYLNCDYPSFMRHVLTPHDPVSDPGAANSAFIDHSAWGIGRHYQSDLGEIMPLVDECGIATLFDVPLVLRFEHLYENTDYRLRIVYFFNKKSPKIHMSVNGITYEDYTEFGIDDRDHTYLISAKNIKNGTIDIVLKALCGTVGPGVSEVWLDPCDN